ncbi:MAG TPA: nucleotidyltransferase, partial [Methanophagales archaeon]|nr:nucleotidyltransferase [Methanophagales archaeon]
DKQFQEKYQEAVDVFARIVKGKYENILDSIILFGSVARGQAK